MRYRRAYNTGDRIQFLHCKTEKTGVILEWLMDRKRYRIQQDSGPVVWIAPERILKKVVEFKMTLD